MVAIASRWSTAPDRGPAETTSSSSDGPSTCSVATKSGPEPTISAVPRTAAFRSAATREASGRAPGANRFTTTRSPEGDSAVYVVVPSRPVTR
ncbi:hypothetical protein [Microbispora sp. H10885]|uniref:hypothetical protein n=1 Tax=Microbispora sp. H10885 TaxID=2729110 RepID=UPI00160183E9|nr:hypothetical protein [Microbispora sp. H10885]